MRRESLGFNFVFGGRRMERTVAHDYMIFGRNQTLQMLGRESPLLMSTFLVESCPPDPEKRSFQTLEPSDRFPEV